MTRRTNDFTEPKGSSGGGSGLFCCFFGLFCCVFGVRLSRGLDDVHEQQLGIVLKGRALGKLDATGEDPGADGSALDRNRDLLGDVEASASILMVLVSLTTSAPELQCR